MVTTGEQLPYQGQILVSNSPVSQNLSGTILRWGILRWAILRWAILRTPPPSAHGQLCASLNTSLSISLTNDHLLIVKQYRMTFWKVSRHFLHLSWVGEPWRADGTLMNLGKWKQGDASGQINLLILFISLPITLEPSVRGRWFITFLFWVQDNWKTPPMLRVGYKWARVLGPCVT